jgi:nicotinamide phosphoribosyltransferase
MQNYNLILDTDSYKISHYKQYPFGDNFKTTGMFSYLESRGGKWDSTVFFGLQYILKEYLSKPVTMADVEEAKILSEAHGEPFNYDGWKYIVEQLGGKIPVRIRAVPEGTVVPVHNILMSCESTDPNVPWVVSYIETLLMRCWYPITVATQSREIKKLIYSYLDKTSDDPDAEISFKLHDFGCRGVSSYESAAWGGASHLVNFMGTDTVPALKLLRDYYNTPMAGYSIPAAEHSTITSWGRDNEAKAYANMLKQYAKPGSILAVVSDSYDIYNACEHIWGGELRQQVIDSGATLVIRPDSGDPTTVVSKCLHLLGKKFGYTVNSKGYRVLNNVRVIQGDGVNLNSIADILLAITDLGWSTSNVGFGCGGVLLQQVNRDTQKFAYKCSSMEMTFTDGSKNSIDVYKDPVTDHGKLSKRGRLDLVLIDGEYKTVQIKDDRSVHVPGSCMHTVFMNGDICIDDDLETIRQRSWNSNELDLAVGQN